MRCLSKYAVLLKKRAEEFVNDLNSQSFWTKELATYKQFKEFLENDQITRDDLKILQKSLWDAIYPGGASQSENPYVYHYVGQHNARTAMLLGIISEKYEKEFVNIWDKGVNISQLENELRDKINARQFLVDKIDKTIKLLKEVVTFIPEMKISTIQMVNLFITKYSSLIGG